jgi:hypothetical protein
MTHTDLGHAFDWKIFNFGVVDAFYRKSKICDIDAFTNLQNFN